MICLIGANLVATAAIASACAPPDRHVLCYGAESGGGGYVRCEFEEVGCDAWEEVLGTYEDQEQCFAAIDAIVDQPPPPPDTCGDYGACAVGRDNGEVDAACGPRPASCICYRCEVDGILQNDICSCESR